MYLDLNIYDNIYKIFGKSFVSPTANNSRFFYKYYLEDSSLIDNQWCYNLKFIPKRKGELTFTGNMWIHDTSFAIKSFHANVSEDINLNFIQDFYFTQEFTRLQDSTWMLKKEKLIADIQLTKKSKMSGFYARKTSERNAFVINKKELKTSISPRVPLMLQKVQEQKQKKLGTHLGQPNFLNKKQGLER